MNKKYTQYIMKVRYYHKIPCFISYNNENSERWEYYLFENAIIKQIIVLHDTKKAINTFISLGSYSFYSFSIILINTTNITKKFFKKNIFLYLMKF